MERESNLFLKARVMITDRTGRHEVLLPFYYKNNYFRKNKESKISSKNLRGQLNIQAWTPLNGQAIFVCESCAVFRVFRNIPSSTLSRFFKTGSVFHFSTIHPRCNPKVYKKSSLNEKRINDDFTGMSAPYQRYLGLLAGNSGY